MRILHYIFIIILCGICGGSCQKELENTETPPVNIDSIISVLPKQIIEFVGPQNVLGVYSIKYDTSNLRIQVYIDDTLTPTPFDELALTYQFNNSGYLIQYKNELAWAVNHTSTISRESDNKISRIVEIIDDGIYGIYYDTIFFNYQQTASGTIITNYHHRDYYPDGDNWKDTVVYTYDHDFNLQQAVMGYDGILNVNLEYNNQKNISKTELRSIEFLMTSEFAYQSGLPEASDDLVMKAFLGKDYYLYWIQRNNPFKIVEEAPFYTFSLTNPQHLTKLTVTEKIPGQVKTYTKTWSYQLDSAKRLSQVRGPYFDDEDVTWIFKY